MHRLLHLSKPARLAGVQMRFLNIHEYQSKRIIKDNGGKVEFGIACSTIDEVEVACSKIKSEKKVVKSQILAGGRGKGTFVDGFKGGVHVCDNAAAAVDAAKHMLGNTLVTKQTGPHGQEVKTLYIT
uniref:Succinyl-CoA ligase [ADP-forming] subunit beta n=1 Tax=Lygus hesperus TaxID=30085 RepID=A0A0A9VS28_LYGHE